METCSGSASCELGLGNAAGAASASSRVAESLGSASSCPDTRVIRCTRSRRRVAAPGPRRSFRILSRAVLRRRSAAFSDDGHVYVVGYRDYDPGFIARHSGDGAADWVSDRGRSRAFAAWRSPASPASVIASSGYGLPTIVRYDAAGRRGSGSGTLADEEGGQSSPWDLRGRGERDRSSSPGCLQGRRPADRHSGSLGAGGSWLWTSSS